MEYTGIATSGMAHTRLRTCGEIVDKNSHPHYDESKKIFLVHNGTITNYEDIKKRYLRNVTFSSDTDT